MKTAPKPIEERIEEARVMGQRAAAAGQKATDNPFMPNEPECAAWGDGFDSVSRGPQPTAAKIDPAGGLLGFVKKNAHVLIDDPTPENESLNDAFTMGLRDYRVGRTWGANPFEYGDHANRELSAAWERGWTTGEREANPPQPEPLAAVVGELVNPPDLGQMAATLFGPILEHNRIMGYPAVDAKGAFALAADAAVEAAVLIAKGVDAKRASK